MWIVPDKRVQNDACISSAERDEQVTEAQPKGNVPALRFPEFTGEWEKCRFGDIATGFDYGMNAAAKPYDGQNKYIRITDIDEASSTYNNEDVVSPDGTLSENYVVNERDILLARTGASTGKSYLYRKSDGKLYYAGFLIRANIAEHNPYFIFSQLHTHRYWRWVSIMSARSGQPGINSQEYASFPIYTTTLIEENKISTLLSLIDERIATQNKIIEKLETLIKGIVESAFNHSATSNTLGCYITQVSQRNKNGKNLPVLSVSNKHGFVEQSEQFEDRIIASDDTSNYKIVSINDFAFNPARINVGSIARLKDKECGIVSPMYICFRTSKDILPEYLELFFKTVTFSSEVGKRLEGSVRLCLSYESLCEIVIPIISISEQQSLVKKATAFYTKLDVEKGFLRNYQSQKQYLLSQMFI